MSSESFAYRQPSQPAALASCNQDAAPTTSGAGAGAVARLDISQLVPYWEYHFQYNGSGEYFWLGPVATDDQKAAALQYALNRRQQWCSNTKAGPACLQSAVIGFRASVCPTSTSGACDSSKVAADIGWTALMARYAAENAALISYLQTHGWPVEYFRQTLEDIKTWQGGMNSYLSSLPSPSAEFVKATKTRLAAMAGTISLDSRPQLQGLIPVLTNSPPSSPQIRPPFLSPMYSVAILGTVRTTPTKSTPTRCSRP